MLGDTKIKISNYCPEPLKKKKKEKEKVNLKALLLLPSVNEPNWREKSITKWINKIFYNL